MTSDIGWKMHEALATMNSQERMAYVRGLLHAYQTVFEDFTTAFNRGEDIHTVFARVQSGHEQVENTRIVKGVA